MALVADGLANRFCSSYEVYSPKPLNPKPLNPKPETPKPQNPKTQNPKSPKTVLAAPLHVLKFGGPGIDILISSYECLGFGVKGFSGFRV